MTRIETIVDITRQLAALDEEGLTQVADIV